MNIDVYLPSGQCASVVLPPHATVSDLAEYWGRGLGGQPGSWNLSKKQCRKNSITQMWWLKPFLNDNGNMERCGCMIVSVADDDCVVGIIPCLRRYTQFYRPNLWIGNWTLLLIRLSVRKFLQKGTVSQFHKQTSEARNKTLAQFLRWFEVGRAAKVQSVFPTAYPGRTLFGVGMRIGCAGSDPWTLQTVRLGRKNPPELWRHDDILDTWSCQCVSTSHVHWHCQSPDRKRVFRRPT